MSYTLVRVVLIAMLLYAAAARAGEADASMFSFRGFGTLGVVHSNEDQADFVNAVVQPDGAGHEHAWAASVDSKLGVQVDARFNDKLSGVVQVVSQYRYDSSYTPQIEWANLAWHVTPDFNLRVGRFATSTFMFSEAGLVGYVYPWIRPPVELYSALPVSNKDGIDASYRFALGAVSDTVQVSYGRTVKRLPDNTEVTVDHYLDVHNSMEIGPTTIRVGYTSFTARADGPQVAPLVDGLTQFSNAASLFGFAAAGQQAAFIASTYLKPRYSIVTVGASYDPGDWLLMAEWAKYSASAQVFKIDNSAWYVTGGYRIAAVTLHLTFAQTKLDKKRLDGIPTAGLPPPLAAGAVGLNTGLDRGVTQRSPGQDSVSVGMRWDLQKNVALKMQYDHLRTGAETSGRLINPQPGFQLSGDTADIFGLALDFVF
jgi:hypothetical protein